jgi:hypothetical protein
MIPRQLLPTLVATVACALPGQEASSGFSMPVTLSGQLVQSPRGTTPGSGDSTFSPGFRAVLYPEFKFGPNWFAFGAVQVYNSPYFYEQLDPGERQERELRFNVLQAYIGYSRLGNRKGIVVKAGQLTPAFGSFALSYDDARNWLIDLPINYGYYYKPVAVTGQPGAEIDVNYRKVDARFQISNSSPANPRKLWDSDQYLNWTAGAGYAFRQEFRLGVSAYRGPYLHRGYPFYFPGEAPPRSLPASGFGVDAQFARGRWNVNGELQRFQFPYRAIPYFFNTSGYVEAKLRLGPRWYVAGRAGRRSQTASLGVDDSYEAVAGFHVAPRQQLKFGLQSQRGAFTRGIRDRVVAVQYVITFDALQAVFR